MPTLIGDVGLKTRSMFTKRSGRPRSLMSSTGETPAPASAERRGAAREHVVAGQPRARRERAARAGQPADEEVRAGSPRSRPAA